MQYKANRSQEIDNNNEPNTDTKTIIKVENDLTTAIPTITDIRQCASLGSILFNIIMDKIIKEVKKADKGYKML